MHAPQAAHCLVFIAIMIEIVACPWPGDVLMSNAANSKQRDKRGWATGRGRWARGDPASRGLSPSNSFRIGRGFAKSYLLEKQSVIGTILPPFWGETVHTLSTQLPAKPLSTKTLVACGGYVNAPTRLTYYEKKTSRVTFAVVPYGCFGLLRFG